jgi:hypothetical protein
VLLLFIGYPGAPRSNQPCPEVSLTSDEAVKLGLKEQIGSSWADAARYEITPANGCTYPGSSAKAEVRGGFRRGQVRGFPREPFGIPPWFETHCRNRGRECLGGSRNPPMRPRTVTLGQHRRVSLGAGQSRDPVLAMVGETRERARGTPGEEIRKPFANGMAHAENTAPACV